MLLIIKKKMYFGMCLESMICIVLENIRVSRIVIEYLYVLIQFYKFL